MHTLRAVIDARGQRVGAADRLYLLEAVPTLIAWGERDRTIPIEHGRAAHAAVPHSRFVTLPGAAHFPHIEAPEALADDAARLDRADRAGRARRGGLARPAAPARQRPPARRLGALAAGDRGDVGGDGVDLRVGELVAERGHAATAAAHERLHRGRVGRGVVEVRPDRAGGPRVGERVAAAAVRR